jgi:hypothetical protein
LAGEQHLFAQGAVELLRGDDALVDEDFAEMTARRNFVVEGGGLGNVASHPIGFGRFSAEVKASAQDA